MAAPCGSIAAERKALGPCGIARSSIILIALPARLRDNSGGYGLRTRARRDSVAGELEPRRPGSARTVDASCLWGAATLGVRIPKARTFQPHPPEHRAGSRSFHAAGRPARRRVAQSRAFFCYCRPDDAPYTCRLCPCAAARETRFRRGEAGTGPGAG